MKKSCIVLILLALAVNIFADDISNIPVTRNIFADEHPEESYEDFISNLEHRETSLQIESITRSGNRGSWLAIVEADLYLQLQTELAVWENDLTREGRNITIISWTGTSFLDLKDTITQYYEQSGIEGVFLLGDLPVFWFELWEDWDANGIQGQGENWVDFPMDAYFADIDGIWSDMDNDGKYDQHAGEMGLEIAVSRIRADNLSMAGDETVILHQWFERNNLYRNGFLADNDQALGYIDDDWENWAGEYEDALNINYPGTEMVSEINSTTAYDFRENRWNADYEWIQVHVHSGPDAHYFYQDNGNNYNLVHNYEIAPYNPTAFFYNLFCCSNARFTQDNAMGSLYMLGNDFGLATIGSTKSGSMLSFENFYTPLSQNETMGNALKIWWNDTMLPNEGELYEQCYRSWFYGMVLTGDPTLKTEYDPVAEIGDIDQNGDIEAYDASIALIYSVGLDPGNAAPLPWGAARKVLADVNGDGNIEAYDAALILQYHVGLINSF